MRGLIDRGNRPCAWVVADKHYGMMPTLLDGVEARGTRYVAEVPASTQVWVGKPQVEPHSQGPLGRPRQHPRVAAGEPKAQEVHQIAARVLASAWQRSTVKEGSKGPSKAMFACLRETTHWVDTLPSVHLKDFQHTLNLWRQPEKRSQCWHARHDFAAYLASLEPH